MKFIFFVILSILAFNTMAKEHPCKEDAKKLCATSKGKHDIHRCMLDHLNELSGECREKISKTKERQIEKMSDIKNSCKIEIKKLCHDKYSSRAELINCLRNNQSKITDLNCKNKLEK